MSAGRFSYRSPEVRDRPLTSSIRPTLQRYQPSTPFPPYAFLPGRDPHPVRDPRGHSFGIDEAPPPAVPADDWRRDTAYLYGTDLYNHGFLWEAHEAWESIWHPAKLADNDQAEHLQGLIQCAAACLKVRMGQPRGLLRLMELGTARLESLSLRVGPHYMGLDLPKVVSAFRAFAASQPKDVEQRPRLEFI